MQVKNTVVDSALDGIGMGLSFTLTLAVMGTIRRLLRLEVSFQTTVFGSMSFNRIRNLAPGGFFMLVAIRSAQRNHQIGIRKNIQLRLCT